MFSGWRRCQTDTDRKLANCGTVRGPHEMTAMMGILFSRSRRPWRPPIKSGDGLLAVMPAPAESCWIARPGLVSRHRRFFFPFVPGKTGTQPHRSRLPPRFQAPFITGSQASRFAVILTGATITQPAMASRSSAPSLSRRSRNHDKYPECPRRRHNPDRSAATSVRGRCRKVSFVTSGNAHSLARSPIIPLIACCLICWRDLRK